MILSVLVQVIVAAIIIGLLWWAYGQLIGLVNMPPPVATVLNVVVVVLLVLALIYYVVLPVLGVLIGALGSGGLHLSH